MKFSTGFFDGLFGKKTTLKMPQDDGSTKDVPVTEAWLKKMLETGKISMSENLYDPIPFHVIDPIGSNDSETRHLRVGIDISREQYQKQADPITGDLYGLTVYENGMPKTSVISKQLWEQAKAQFEEMERTYQESTENYMSEINTLMSAKKKPTQPPSEELQKWLDTRKKAGKARADLMMKEGICVMPRGVTPEELEEPLKTEAIEYLRQRGEWRES